jgi:hypothetical protein
MTESTSLSDQADRLEFEQMRKLGELMIYRSQISKLADGEWSPETKFSLGPLKPSLMGEDPRLPKMPEKPTLIDFFNLRFGPSKQHLLQSAALARKNGLSEKMVLACLLHDISVIAFFRPDHGYWGAQMLEPYGTRKCRGRSACTSRCASSPIRWSATNIPRPTPSGSAPITGSTTISSATTRMRGTTDGTCRRG